MNLNNFEIQFYLMNLCCEKNMFSFITLGEGVVVLNMVPKFIDALNDG